MSSFETSPREVPYLVWSAHLSFLEGQLLTLIEAVTSDPQQRKAIKNLLSPMLWTWAISQPQLESEGLDSPNFKLISK